ncbi:hypothetical protein CHUAL_012583 [Chamberlinius hualienensis]
MCVCVCVHDYMLLFENRSVVEADEVWVKLGVESFARIEEKEAITGQLLNHEARKKNGVVISGEGGVGMNTFILGENMSLMKWM